MKKHILLGLGAAFLAGAASLHADATVSSSTSSQVTVSSGTTTVNSGVVVTMTSTDQEAVKISGASTLVNNGTIRNTRTTSADDSRAIRVNTSGSALAIITNNSTGIIEAAAADGIQNKNDTAVTVNNYGTLRVLAAGGQAIDFNKILTKANTVNNYAGASITSVGADAIRTGVNGVVNNAGFIGVTLVMVAGDADSSDGIDAQTNAGAVITNTGTIQGRHGITGGPTSAPSTLATWITITNGSATGTSTQNAAAILQGLNGAGVNIDGVYATARTVVTNYGVIKGQWDGVSANGDGDGVDVDGLAVVTNYGTISALSSTGVGSDGLTNTADGVSIGGGTVDNKAGATISSAGRGILVDNSSQGNAVAAFTLTNAGTITSANGAAVGITSTFANTITNIATGVISGGNSLQATLDLGAGDDTVTNSGTIRTANGATVAIRMGAGNDMLNILGGSITGSIDGGTGVNTLNYNIGAGNSYTASSAVTNFGVVNVNSGTVVITTAAALGDGSVYVNGGVLDLNGIAVTNNITLAGGKLAGAAGYEGAVVLSGNAAATGTVSGQFNTGTDTARVIDTTGGVTFDGTLKGRGTFSGGLVTINGIHAVGNSPGLQAFTAGITYGAASVFEWEFAGNALVARGTDFDAVNVTGGTATITNGALLKIINFSGIDYSDAAWSADRSFVVLDASGAVSLDGAFALDVTEAGDTSGKGSWSLDETGGNVVAKWTATAVPEPSTYGLIGAGIALVAARVRRRRKTV